MKTFQIEKKIKRNASYSNACVKIVNGEIHAEVFRIICQQSHTTKRELKGKKFFARRENSGGSIFWMLSNLGSHSKNVHKIQTLKPSSHSSTDNDTDDFAKEIVQKYSNTDYGMQNTVIELRSFPLKLSSFDRYICRK